jgi:hypothetical protein
VCKSGCLATLQFCRSVRETQCGRECGEEKEVWEVGHSGARLGCVLRLHEKSCIWTSVGRRKELILSLLRRLFKHDYKNLER